MRFLRAVKGRRRSDRIPNDEIRMELKMQPLNVRIKKLQKQMEGTSGKDAKR